MSEKIYCANCKHCLVLAKPSVISDQFVLRLHCDKDQWKKKVGEVKYYKFFTASRRTMEFCEYFSSLGEDERNFVKELKKTLPIKDEIYSEK